MADKITKRLINKLVPHTQQPGTYRFNHEGCPAGEDTKRRLYITIPDGKPDVRLAYCHNCGGSNMVRARSDSYTRNTCYSIGGSYEDYLPTNKFLKSARNYEYSPDPHSLLTPEELNEYPDSAKTILRNAHLTREQIHKYNICFDSEMHRLMYFYPKDDHDKASYVQLRAVESTQKIKYLGYKLGRDSDDDRSYPFSSDFSNDTRLLVITEDLLSSIRVAEVAGSSGVWALPLAGTFIRIESLYRYAEQFDRILVWLDNDSKVVLNQAADIAQSLLTLGMCETVLYTEPKEPKHMVDKELFTAVVKQPI